MDEITNKDTNEIIELQTAGENVTPDPSLGDTDEDGSASALDAQSATAALPHVSEVHPTAEAESSAQTQRQTNDCANGSTGNSPDQMPNPYDLSTEKQDGQTVLRMHTPQPRVTRLKPRAVMLILLAAAGAVGMALFIGLGGAPSVPQVQRSRPSSNSVIQSSGEVADNNALLSTLPQTYTWPQADNHAVTTVPGHLATPARNSSVVSKSTTAPDQQRMRDLKSLQRQWRQAMNAPVVFAGMADSANSNGGTGTWPMANASSPDAGNGLLASGGVIPPGFQRPYGNSIQGIDSGDQGTAIQQEHRTFMKSSVSVQSYLAQPLTPPTSPYEIQAGTVIPGALVTGINSDLPGQIIGTVTQNIFDSVSGKYLLIPQGSRLLGRYSSVVGNGENRVLVAWQRLIMPNGESIVLDAMPGTNQEGQSGLHDRVNYHFAKLAQAAA